MKVYTYIIYSSTIAILFFVFSVMSWNLIRNIRSSSIDNKTKTKQNTDTFQSMSRTNLVECLDHAESPNENTLMSCCLFAKKINEFGQKLMMPSGKEGNTLQLKANIKYEVIFMWFQWLILCCLNWLMPMLDA